MTTQTMNGQRLLTTQELADRWGASAGALTNDRHKGKGPSYCKLGDRVRYRLEDILAWEEQHLVSAENR